MPFQRISPSFGPFVTFRNLLFIFYTGILGKVYPCLLYNTVIVVIFIWRRSFPTTSCRALITRDPLNTILVKPLYRATVKLHDWYWTDSIVVSRQSDRNHALSSTIVLLTGTSGGKRLRELERIKFVLEKQSSLLCRLAVRETSICCNVHVTNSGSG